MALTNYSNALINETSPYLLQHAHNPVYWYPWGQAALDLAKQHNKPILLSIGYSACHWCHVMAHESFENPQTASIMNELFINIKVDREERPDLDKIYQLAHHSTSWRLAFNDVFKSSRSIPVFWWYLFSTATTLWDAGIQ